MKNNLFERVEKLDREQNRLRLRVVELEIRSYNTRAIAKLLGVIAVAVYGIASACYIILGVAS